MPRHKPFPERFWDKVEKSCGCWIWKGKKSDSGYGIVYVSASRRRMAHRVALELSSGEAVPDEIDVLHSCDNPPCVNPAHLFLGTHTDNMRDMVAKGRSFSQKNPMMAIARMVPFRKRPPLGELHHLATLDNTKVLAIRSFRAEGLTQKQIAARIQCGRSTVQRVLSGIGKGSWAHVTGNLTAQQPASAPSA